MKFFENVLYELEWKELPALQSPLRHAVHQLPGGCLSGPFGQNLLLFNSVSAPCSCFTLCPVCDSCSVLPFSSLTCLPGSLSSLACWAALKVGVTFPARANLTPWAAVRTKSQSPVASAVHLQAFNTMYCMEVKWIPLFSSLPWSHCHCLRADCSSPQPPWFSWPTDEGIAVQLFRCC